MNPPPATAAKSVADASQHVHPKSDIEIAQAARMRPIVDIAREKLGIAAAGFLCPFLEFAAWPIKEPRAGEVLLKRDGSHGVSLLLGAQAALLLRRFYTLAFPPSSALSSWLACAATMRAPVYR